MLVVGQADGVGPHLPDERHVRVVVLLGDGVADALPVLVAAHPPQGIGPPVEEEALLGVYPEGAHPEPGGHPVHLLAVHHQRHLAGVQVGVFHPVPQPDVGHRQGDIRPRADGHGFTGGVRQLHPYLGALHMVEGLHPHPAVLPVHAGGDFQPLAAAVVQLEVVLGDKEQQHVPVDAAVEGEVRLLGVHPVVDAVVHVDGEGVLVLEQVRHVPAEGGVAAVVGAHLGAVQLHLRGGVHPPELQVDPLVRPEFRLGKPLFIDARPPPVVVPPVLAIDGVPGVGQGNRAWPARRARECPARVQVDCCSQIHPPAPPVAHGRIK